MSIIKEKHMRKQIGIVTYCQGTNYGSILQAFAMRKILERKGFDVCFLVYKNSMLNKRKLFNLFMYLFTKPKSVYKYMRNIIHNHSKKENSFSNNRIEEFARKELQINVFGWKQLEAFARQDSTKCCICGSDQIWNMLALYIDPSKFLRFAPRNKRIAYAPSFGETVVPKFMREIMKKYLSSIPKISIREDSGQEIVKELIGVEVPVVLDPVFLLQNRDWQNLIAAGEQDEPYIILYFLNKPSNLAVENILELKKQYNCKVCIFNEKYTEFSSIVDEVIVADPLEFVRIIANARIVCTDSFHGTAFSIIMHTNFFTFERQYKAKHGNGDRITSILSKVGLQDRFIKESSNNIKFVQADINFCEVEELLSKEREKSLDYLLEALNNIKVKNNYE